MDADRLAEIAVELARRVREDDIDDVGEWLLANTTDAERWVLHFVQAAAGRTSTDAFYRATSWTRPAPLRHVDEIAVERACRGEPVPLTMYEKRVAVATMLRRGFSDCETARRSGMSRRQVARIRLGEAQHTPAVFSHPRVRTVA